MRTAAGNKGKTAALLCWERDGIRALPAYKALGKMIIFASRKIRIQLGAECLCCVYVLGWTWWSLRLMISDADDNGLITVCDDSARIRCTP